MTLTFGHLFQWSSGNKTWERFYNRVFFPISAQNKQEGRREEEEEISPSSFSLNVHFSHNHTRGSWRQAEHTTVPRGRDHPCQPCTSPPSTGLACRGWREGHLIPAHWTHEWTDPTKQWPQPAKHLPWSVAELSISVVRLNTDKEWT